ncbi:MAG: GNAT family N-acetyltransferase [Propionibacteriales bacterium]|nr:GNAT family N-acetyltransferase [Propionibacteriales bacterium]
MVRARTSADLPALTEVLARQQPASRYPFRWPLPFPSEDFIARPGERAAWVAEVDGRVAGHVSVTGIVGDADHGELVDAWTRATGVGVDQLGCLSVLFADVDVRGRGVGRALMDAAEGWIIDHGLHPVLDVVPIGAPMALYASRGWRVVGQARPPWLPDDEPPMQAMVLDRSLTRS